MAAQSRCATIDNLQLLFRGCQSTLNQSDREKCSLKSEQKRKANLSLFTYRNACRGTHPKGTAYLFVRQPTPWFSR